MTLPCPLSTLDKGNMAFWMRDAGLRRGDGAMLLVRE